jgi:hypothetical protein
MSAEREGAPEDFAWMAAAARGRGLPTKQERNRKFVELQHSPEPEPEGDTDAEKFVTRLFAPKAGHADLVRLLHPEEPE